MNTRKTHLRHFIAHAFAAAAFLFVLCVSLTSVAEEPQPTYESIQNKTTQEKNQLLQSALAHFCASSQAGGPVQASSTDSTSSQMQGQSTCLECELKALQSAPGLGAISAALGKLKVVTGNVKHIDEVRREVKFLQIAKSNGQCGESGSDSNLSKQNLISKIELYSKELENVKKEIEDRNKKISKMEKMNLAMKHLSDGTSFKNIPEEEKLALEESLDSLRKGIQGYINQLQGIEKNTQKQIAFYKANGNHSSNDTTYYQKYLENTQLKRQEYEEELKTIELFSSAVSSGQTPSNTKEVLKIINTNSAGGVDELKSEVAYMDKNATFYQEAIHKYEGLLQAQQEAEQVKNHTEKNQSGENELEILEAKLRDLESECKFRISDISHNPGYHECGMSVAERIAIIFYTGSGYAALNKSLRKGGNIEENDKIFRETLNSALSKLSRYEGFVIRGATLPAEVRNQHQVGSIVNYSAFTSTSLVSGFLGTDRFVIRSHNGHFVAPVSSINQEQEVLFESDTKFKVIAVNEKSGYREYIMEELGH